MIGQTFGQIKVIADAGTVVVGKKRKVKRQCYLCLCVCGKTWKVIGNNLRIGGTKSCGCTKAKNIRQAKFIHGRNGYDPTYSTWIAMRRRCYDKKFAKYATYGAKGITVCERWSEFNNFLADMGERPTGKTLDRIDNTGNYEPKNCRWASSKEQRANQGKTQ